MTNDTPHVSMRVQRVLAAANDEAARLHHEYIGTEHLLLALTADEGGVAVAALQNLGVKLGDVRTRIETTVRPGKPGEPPGKRPYTTRTQRVLQLSESAARELGHSYVGTEHLLLGMLDEQKGIAAQVLVDAGVRAESARAEIRRILGPEISG